MLFVGGAIAQYLGAALAVLLFKHVRAAGVAELRVCSAAVVLVLWRRPRLRGAGLPPASWGLIAAFGAALALMNLVFYEAIARIPVGTAVAIEFIGPVSVAALGSRRGRDWAGLALAAAGVLLVADVHLAHASSGVLLALAAALLWAIYIVLGHRVARAGRPGIDALALAMCFGSVAIAPLSAPAAAHAFNDIWTLAAVIGVGLMSSVIPYSIDQITLRRLPRHRFALLLAVLPATAAVIGSIVLGQFPSALEVAGIALVMASIVLTQEPPAPIAADSSADRAAGRGGAVGREQDDPALGVDRAEHEHLG
jgi:inner membrane transporter RhtA